MRVVQKNGGNMQAGLRGSFICEFHGLMWVSNLNVRPFFVIATNCSPYILYLSPPIPIIYYQQWSDKDSDSHYEQQGNEKWGELWTMMSVDEDSGNEGWWAMRMTTGNGGAELWPII